MSYFVGLDISKGSIDVCFLEEEERSYVRYTNDAEGHGHYSKVAFAVCLQPCLAGSVGFGATPHKSAGLKY